MGVPVVRGRILYIRQVGNTCGWQHSRGVVWDTAVSRWAGVTERPKNKTAEPQGEREEFKKGSIGKCEATPVVHLKMKTKKEPKGGGGKEPKNNRWETGV